MIKDIFIFNHPVYKNVVFQDGDNFCKAFAEAQVHTVWVVALLLIILLLYENEFESAYENKDEIQTYLRTEVRG